MNGKFFVIFILHYGALALYWPCCLFFDAHMIKSHSPFMWIFFGFFLWSVLALFSAATRRGHDLDMTFWKVWFAGRLFGVFFTNSYAAKKEASRQTVSVRH